MSKRLKANRHIPPQPKTLRTSFGIKLIVVVAIAVVIAGLAVAAPLLNGSSKSSTSSSASEAAKFDSLYDLMECSHAELENIDIALVNLLCAKDLPGGESVDIPRCLRLLDEWADRVKFDTDRHLYRHTKNPGEFHDSEAFYRMMMLVTVLQQDCGIRYNPERSRNPDFRDSRDLFIHGLLGKERTGTCLSMPVLYIAIGRRLGYPLTLAQARGHLYVRWEGDGTNKHINIEATSLGLHWRDDAHFRQWPEPLSAEELSSGAYLRGLTRLEELAVFLHARAHCEEDTGAMVKAVTSYALAQQCAPHFPNSRPFLHQALSAMGQNSN